MKVGGTPTAASELQRPSAINGEITRTWYGEAIKQSAGQSRKVTKVPPHERSRRAAVICTGCAIFTEGLGTGLGTGLARTGTNTVICKRGSKGFERLRYLEKEFYRAMNSLARH